MMLVYCLNQKDTEHLGAIDHTIITSWMLSDDLTYGAKKFMLEAQNKAQVYSIEYFLEQYNLGLRKPYDFIFMTDKVVKYSFPNNY